MRFEGTNWIELPKDSIQHWIRFKRAEKRRARRCLVSLIAGGSDCGMIRIIPSACTHCCTCQLKSVLALRTSEFVITKIVIVSLCGTICHTISMRSKICWWCGHMHISVPPQIFLPCWRLVNLNGPDRFVYNAKPKIRRAYGHKMRTSCFRRGVYKIYVLLGRYAALIGSYKQSVGLFGSTGCPETPVTNYQSTPNIPEECRPQIQMIRK